ncbi:hypothetical protein RZS08_06645 [Arthrospira platensis SPKY1]|nr:hypothetical protein [Arthrospira platensis SPKY1]
MRPGPGPVQADHGRYLLHRAVKRPVHGRQRSGRRPRGPEGQVERVDRARQRAASVGPVIDGRRQPQTAVGRNGRGQFRHLRPLYRQVRRARNPGRVLQRRPVARPLVGVDRGVGRHKLRAQLKGKGRNP